jgi:hypothetical protein
MFIVAAMSFQAYLDTIEDKTGLTPRQLVNLAAQKGLDDPNVKAGEILGWLRNDYGLGRGHGMALVHVIKKGPRIDTKHVGTAGSHRDESATLWLDGKASKPARPPSPPDSRREGDRRHQSSRRAPPDLIEPATTSADQDEAT